MGLSEVQVGLPLPPVILAALCRLVGPRQAERLAVRGLLITPTEAAACGLVDELAPADQVVGRAVQWCESLLALPRTAMEITRRQARADLVAKFARDNGKERAEVTAWGSVGWWSNSR
jgi:enoyl-CoA hydratase/carnithine racemase